MYKQFEKIAMTAIVGFILSGCQTNVQPTRSPQSMKATSAVLRRVTLPICRTSNLPMKSDVFQKGVCRCRLRRNAGGSHLLRPEETITRRLDSITKPYTQLTKERPAGQRKD